MNDMTSESQIFQNIIAPLQQEGTKAVLRTWLSVNGDRVTKDQPIVELETDKVVVEISAPGDGVLEIVLSEGSDAEPGALLGRVVTKDVEFSSAQVEGVNFNPSVADTVLAPPEMTFAPEMRLSPSVRRLLVEHSLDPLSLAGLGSGRGGRLTREDVIAFIAKPAPVKMAEPIPTSTAVVASGPRVAAHVPHSSMRRKIAEHMHHSVNVAPHVTAVFEADFSAIIAHRNKHKKDFEKDGLSLTYTAYFIAAAEQAMRAVPEVNSRWHDDYLEIFKDVNIGIGTSLGDKGLIVPVIREVQDLSLRGIASRLHHAIEAARVGRLKPSDVQGGTFTISNHGVSGSLFASPIIINQPQSAILGIGALEKRMSVVPVDGLDTLQIRPKAYVSLTIDHRVLDGSQTNLWLKRFVEVIEHWAVQD